MGKKLTANDINRFIRREGMVMAMGLPGERIARKTQKRAKEKSITFCKKRSSWSLGRGEPSRAQAFFWQELEIGAAQKLLGREGLRAVM